MAAIILLALALRVVRLGFQPLWWDEGYSVWFSHRTLADMVRLTAEDIHPPLYYAVLGAWSQLVGLRPPALRLLSVAIGVVTVPLAAVVGAWLAGRRTGLLAAFLLAINPFAVYYSQEVRMYALVGLWSLLALGCAVRWLGLGWGTEDTGKIGAWWLAAYVAAMTAALYTQYYAGFLAAGLTVAGLVWLWQRRAGRRRALVWIAAQAAIALLYLPWVLYAAPRLLPYVSQKVVADSDRPLGLLEYVARHLSAFVSGHWEGPLAPWWALGLLGLLPLMVGLWQLRSRPGTAGGSVRSAIAFLSITLGVVLILGWLVNLTFPFFPERGERLLLLGAPLLVLLLASVIAAVTRPGWLPVGRPGVLLVLPLVALAALTLVGFYTFPRYSDEDYRPLIGQVTQWGRPEDTVVAVFPWQVGYFWSYGNHAGPQPVLLPGAAWGPQVIAALDDALLRGRVWFPEHLSMGGLLETAAESYLASSAYQLANRWYSPSTRLTGWAAPAVVAPATQGARPGVTATLADGSALSAAAPLPPLPAANTATPVDLAFAGSSRPRWASLRLVGPDGLSWAQQDYAVDAAVERLALLLPSGTPPGAYRLLLGLAPDAGGAPLAITGPAELAQQPELPLGQQTVLRPEPALAVDTLPLEHRVDADLDDSARLLGYSATAGPLQPGDDLAVSLFWQALPALAQYGSSDLRLFVQLLGADGKVAAGWEGPPVAWHGTSAWRAGDLVRSQQVVRLPATLPDGRYRLITGLFDPASGRRLTARWKSGLLGWRTRQDDRVSLTAVEVQGREHLMTPPSMQHWLAADLSRLARLAGYDLSSGEVTPGGTLDMALYWQPRESTGDRLAVFVHLLDEQGRIVGQSDGEPAGGAAPTSSWLPGETVVDRRTVHVRPDAVPGPATLVVGLYDPVTGARVPWQDGGDALRLPQEIAVEAR